jgi:hypothetical protein
LGSCHLSRLAGAAVDWRYPSQSYFNTLLTFSTAYAMMGFHTYIASRQQQLIPNHFLSNIFHYPVYAFHMQHMIRQ